MTLEATRDAVAAARRAIGDGRPDDYVLRPTSHAAELEAQAPALAAILRGARAEVAAAEFERHDAEALEAQARFKRTAGRANLAVLLTACLSAGVLLVGPLDALPGGEVLRRSVLAVLGVASLISGGMAAMWLYQLKQGSLLDRWNSARARAETRRYGYFGHVMEVEVAPGGDPPIDLLRLEYFRRFQLDVQVAYYRESAKRHRRAADGTLRLEAVAVLLATVGAGLGGLVASLADRPELAGLAAVGVVGAALAAYGGAREAISQDRRNAERYDHTLSALLTLRERLDEVRAAAVAGNREAVLAFVDAVHEQLSVEHREWLEASEATRTGIGLLDASLERTRRAP